MRPRRRPLLFAVAALLGVLVVVLPAVAGSETTPTITAVNEPGGGYYGESHHWSPATATVGAGGVVTLSNPSDVNHGVEWVKGPAIPVCSGVPTSTSSETSGKQWSGTCTFTTPGTYTFYCTVHGPEMTGTVTVNANGTTTTSMTTTQAPAPVPSAGGAPTPGSTPASPGPGPQATSGPVALGSPLTGSPSSAVKLPAIQHGDFVRGSVDVSPAGSGGRLEVQLLARRASLASAAHTSQAQVGRLTRSSLQPGPAGFTVTLDTRARRALRAHRRLAVSVKILLTAPAGAAVAITRSVVLHR